MTKIAVVTAALVSAVTILSACKKGDASNKVSSNNIIGSWECVAQHDTDFAVTPPKTFDTSIPHSNNSIVISFNTNYTYNTVNSRWQHPDSGTYVLLPGRLITIPSSSGRPDTADYVVAGSTLTILDIQIGTNSIVHSKSIWNKL